MGAWAYIRSGCSLPAPTASCWELNLITRLLADPSIGSRTQGLLSVIETPEAMEGYLLRAQSQDDA